jgi:phospholipid/cholesterol/gamma-HCH transport system permease protein
MKHVVNFLTGLGQGAHRFLVEVGQQVLLVAAIHRWMGRRPFDGNLIVKQMARIGVDTIPVAVTTALFTGMVLALQTGYTLETKMKGVSQFVGSVVTLSMVRELGPVLTALIVSGRVGSAVAAEIGSMKVTEQIDALHTLAANPIKYLAVPRYIAFILMLPLLTVFADLTGWLGGLFVATTRLSSTATIYIDASRDVVGASDILGGLFKALFFGAAIAVVSCHQGFSTEGGAEGVGRATTKAVVVSFMVILVSDYFLTALLTLLKW